MYVADTGHHRVVWGSSRHFWWKSRPPVWTESKLCRVASCDDFVQIFSYQLKHRICFCGITVPWPLTSMWSCPAVEAIVLALLAVPRCWHWRRGHNEAVALEESKCPTCHGIFTEALHPGCGEHAGFGCWSHSPATQWDRVPMLHGHQEADLGFCRLPLFARINGSTTHSVIHRIRVLSGCVQSMGFTVLNTTTLYSRCCPWPSHAVCLPAVHELKGTLHVFHWQVAGTDRTSGCPSSAIRSPAIPSDSASPRPGTNASLLDNPTALALSGDKLYVADARRGWDGMVGICEFRDLLWFCRVHKLETRDHPSLSPGIIDWWHG